MMELAITPKMGWPRAMFCGLLSLVTPGLGQVHARAWRFGVALLTLEGALSAALRLATRAPPSAALLVAVFLITGVVCLCLNIGSAVDAVRRARRTPQSPRAPWVRSTLLAAIVAYSAFGLIGVALPLGWRSFSMSSGSNSPTLLVGDHILADVNKAGLLPARGALIVFDLPRHPTIPYVKRVIGLPGDRVQMLGGALLINGEPVQRAAAGVYDLDEYGRTNRLTRYEETLANGRTYAILKSGNNGPLDNTPEYRVPDDSIFVLGDYRDNSLDSRDQSAFGYVPIRNIIGEAAVILWSQDRTRIGMRLNPA
jgi:signal peptidase I